MRNRIFLSAVLACSLVAAEEMELGTIYVESSTIEGIAPDARTEASTVNDINETTIEQIDPKNINDILQTIPGVTADVRSDSVEIHIRGVNQQEFMWEDTGVAVVIDGVPVMQDGGKVRGINVDEIESIKVIKGSAAYLYGADASAGAIIITTKKPKAGSGIDLGAEAGSYGFQDYRARAYKTTDRYAFNIFANYKKEDGYWYQTSNYMKTGNGKFTYYIDESSDLTLNVAVTKGYEETTRGGVTGITEARKNPKGNDEDLPWGKDYYSDIYRYSLTYNKDFSDTANLQVIGYYYKDLYNYKSSPQDTNGDDIEDTYTRDNDDDIKQYGIKSEFRDSIGDFAYMLGLDIGKREYDEYRETIAQYSSYNWWTHSYETYYVGESSLDQSTEEIYAVYGEGKYQVTDRFTAVLNLRYDYNKYSIDVLDHEYDDTNDQWIDTRTTGSEDFRNLTYRVGATYELSEDHILYGNVATGFRNPSVTQKADNPDLDKETYITYEIGLRGNLAYGLRYQASAFITDTKDIISKADGTYNWDSDNFANVGDARNQGIELSLKSDQSKQLSFSLAYTYLNAYYTSHDPFYIQGITDANGDPLSFDVTGNKLPRVPHHKVDLIVNYQFLPKWNLMTELYAQSRYYADETNFVSMPGYGKVNLRLDYKLNKNLNFYMKLDNVLDKQYFRTVYLFRDRNRDGKLDAEDATITVDPGRVFYAGIRYKF